MVQDGFCDCPPGCLCESTLTCRGIDLSQLTFTPNNYEFLDLRKNKISTPLQIPEHWAPSVFTDLMFVDLRGVQELEILCDSVVEMRKSFPNVSIVSDCSRVPELTTVPPPSPPKPQPQPQPPSPPQDPARLAAFGSLIDAIIGLVAAAFVSITAIVLGAAYAVVRRIDKENNEYERLRDPRGKRRWKVCLKEKKQKKKPGAPCSSTESLTDKSESDDTRTERRSRRDKFLKDEREKLLKEEKNKLGIATGGAHDNK